MRYRLRDIPEMLRTPLGRLLIRRGVNYQLWPIAFRLAQLYRSTVVRRTRVIAVVGSLGKSTTLRAVASVIGMAVEPFPVGNAWTGVAHAILNIRRYQTHAVIEVGITAPGQMEAYARMVRPSVAIVTSIASEHQRSLGSLEVTRAEKARMVRALPPSGTAILNGDDPNVLWMRGQTAGQVVTFGYGESCDVRASDVRLDWPRGTRFRLRAFGQERDVATRLIGRHMVYPVLAAIAVSQIEGYPLDQTLSRLQALAPTAGRMEPLELANGVLLLRDDFKSTLETIHSALDAMAEIPGRRIVLMGDISEPPIPQRPAHGALGERVAGFAAFFITVGNAFLPYRSGARRGGLANDYIIDGGRTPRQAAQALAKVVQPGDVVLLKGRDTQKLERVHLILEGHQVGCDIRFCNLRAMSCADCPMLERGWGAHRNVMQVRESDGVMPDTDREKGAT